MRTISSLRDIESVQVSVEERRILMDGVDAENWRKHTYSELKAVPEILPPSFGLADAKQHEVNLHALIRQLSVERRQRATFQLPYTEAPAGDTRHGPTVLRTIDIQLTYKAKN